MKKLLFILISLLIGIVFCLVLLELFFLMNPKLGYTVSSYCADDELMFRRKRLSPLLGWENIPDFNGINSYGLIGKERRIKKDKDTFRILILGDSVGEGFDIGFLEGQLNDNSALHSKYNFEVWNASVGAYDIRHYYLYLKNKGLHYAPDMVVIFFCLNDFDLDANVYYLNEKGFIQHNFSINSELFKRHVPNHFLMQRSHLYRFLILRMDTYLSYIEKKKNSINFKERNGEYYLRNIKNICKQNNLHFFIVIFPYLKPLNEYRYHQIQQYQDIKQAVKHLNIDYLDLHEYLPQKDLYSLRVDKGDEIHPKGDKAHAIDKVIYNYLLDNFFQR